ncbi:MAG: alpha/beta fold hydrolase [Robiginitomaculum sp.]|nr:alpha/beta fold hydrolase [Robiginitomaculum sp.]
MSLGEKRYPEIRYPVIGKHKIRTARWLGTGEDNVRPLLFFNGIGANLELVAPLGEAFMRRDIVTFDMPGVGRSKPTLLPYRPWQMARLAAKVMDHFGYDKVDVMGVSWGGALAQQFAFQYQKRVGQLVLAATSPGVIMVPGKWKALSKMGNPRRYIDPEYMRRNFNALYGDETGKADKHILNLMPPHPRGYLYQMLAFSGWSSLPFLPFLKIPTLILAGDRDNIIPLANAKLLKMALKYPEIYVVKGGGHLFMVSKAHEIVPVMRDFFNKADALSRPELFRGRRHAMPDRETPAVV